MTKLMGIIKSENKLTGGLGVRNEINVDIIGTGARGKEGKSTYEIWLDLGNEGTEEEYFASLKGDTGDSGVYTGNVEPIEESVKVWVNPDGNIETEPEEIIPILKFKDDGGTWYDIPAIVGATGKSAYEAWLNDGHVGTETDFLQWLKASNNYTHIQEASSYTWTINHNLDKHPSVFIIDTGGNWVIGDVQYLNENQIIVRFTYEFSGRAYLN